MKRKHIYLFALSFLAGSPTAFAQGEMDAYKLSQTDLMGTARSVGMGGAVGAMGGDISAVSVNPAGIGYFTTSQVITTMNFQNVNTKSHINAGDMKEDKFKFNFSNLAFVGTFPIENDVVPLLNFGFSYNRLKNFDRKYGVRGNNVKSISGYMAGRASDDDISDPDNELSVNGNYPFRDYDWLSIFGYNGGLINYDGNRQFSAAIDGASTTTNSDLFVREKGYVDSYDFSFGTNIDNVVSVGLTVSVTDIDYRRYSYYSEYFSGSQNGDFYLENGLKTEGTGVQVAAGVIVQPIPEFRFGLSYHTPTWYNMTDYYNADLGYSNTSGGYTVIDSWSDGTYRDYDNYTDYRLRTPDKFTFSATGVVGPVLLSADYEFTNYKSNMRLNNDKDNGNYLNYGGTNESIKNHFKGASAIRVGAEISITKQFTGRVGYAWKESPIKKNLKDGKDEVMTVGSDSQYILDGDTHNITWGLGYRFTKNFFADMAFVYKKQDGDLYSFYGSNRAKIKTNTFQGLLSLGYRF